MASCELRVEDRALRIPSNFQIRNSRLTAYFDSASRAVVSVVLNGLFVTGERPRPLGQRTLQRSAT
jgi:hypothetical protein